MRQQQAFQLCWRYLHALCLDPAQNKVNETQQFAQEYQQLLYAVGDKERSNVIDICFVACKDPSIGEGVLLHISDEYEAIATDLHRSLSYY